MLQEELVTTAPAFAGLSKQRFALLEVDPEAYAQHQQFLSTLGTRGFQKDPGVEWQYDGMTYPENDDRRQGPLKPGQTTIVPLAIAEHGITRAALAWHQEQVDMGDGRVAPRLDFRQEGKPLLRIIRIFEPGRVDRLLAEAAEQTSLCPWCDPMQAIPTVEFKQHVEREHFAGPGPAAAPAASSHRNTHVEEEGDE